MKHVRIGFFVGLLAVTSAALIAPLAITSAHAAGWGSVHKYVKRTGNCAGQEVLASSYSSGKRTATGERFDASGNTAAARTWPLGTTLTVTNPQQWPLDHGSDQRHRPVGNCVSHGRPA